MPIDRGTLSASINVLHADALGLPIPSDHLPCQFALVSLLSASSGRRMLRQLLPIGKRHGPPARYFHSRGAA